MDKGQVKRIFDFLEEKGEHNAPFMWKLINNEPLTKEDLNVKGDLDLRFLSITSLPKGLEVGGSLHLAHCKELTSLPKGLKVGGSLYIYETPLTKYSGEELREMIKPGFIKYDIVT